METKGNSRITGLGAYLPATTVTSDDLMKEVKSTRFGIPEDYISRHVGILERRFAAREQQPSDLATLASELALGDAGVNQDEIDLIIYTGITRDCEEPSTAHYVQRKLSAANAFCMDVSNACLGFMTGLSLADACIAQKSARTVLVCTGEAPSKMIDEVIGILNSTDDKDYFKNRLGFLTAGDAGGAAVVQPSEGTDTGLQWMDFWSRGKLAPLCYYHKDKTGLQGEMLMKEISREIVGYHAENIETTYYKLGWTPQMVDKIYCHQVGRKPHKMLVRLTGKTVNDAPITYDRFGNLTSATIPVDMYLNPPEKGSRVLFLGTGSGLAISQGGMVF